jgi:hypothetical protein
MPRGDRTGPWGLGEMTGRGAGFCAGYSVPGYANSGWVSGFRGRPFGCGPGRGFRWRNWFCATGVTGWQRFQRPAYGPPMAVQAPFYPPMDRETEMNALKAEAAELEQSLKEVNERLAKLEEQQKG